MWGKPRNVKNMALETFKIKGFVVEPYFQSYLNLDDPNAKSGELLTRLENGESTFELLGTLTEVEHFALLEWLVETSNFLKSKLGIHSSVNVDNKLVLAEKSREEFLRIAGLSDPATTFEFTETHAMPDAGDANQMFRRLRDQGHTCALDDFGSGLNGMTMLTEYDFDIVKVDRQLTLDIDSRPEKSKVLSLLYEMVTALNKSHVVEGIEKQEVYDLLVEAGYRVFQGYLFDKPKPISQLIDSQTLEEQR
jgi:EAL domain-containing protein (putative c-di-GMP-specific phosphodiesterase class I)